MMEPMATTTLLTWEEFERLPERAGKRELLKGELIELPPPKPRHGTTSERTYRRLYAALEEAHARGEARSLGEVHIEWGYLLRDVLGQRSWLQPDVSMTHAGQPQPDYVEGSPAIAIEVVSPSNTPRQLADKTAAYFESGALEVWHFYPDERHVVAHVAGADPVTIRDFVTTPLLPGLALNVQEILSV
jgi:Uma2 family endonuclease